MIEYADLVLAFWDGASRGTKFVIDNCKSRGIPVRVLSLSTTVSQAPSNGGKSPGYSSVCYSNTGFTTAYMGSNTTVSSGLEVSIRATQRQSYVIRRNQGII